MPTHWNPTQVLDLYGSPGAAACSGMTKRRARCEQHMFSQADRSKTATILVHMSQCQPQLGFARDLLEDLAYLTLCPKWHRKPGYSQVEEVVRRFDRTIEAYCTQLRRAVPRDAVRSTRGIESPPTRRIELVEDLPLPNAPRRLQRMLSPSPSVTNESTSASHREPEPVPASESRSDDNSSTNISSRSRLSAQLHSHHRQPQAGTMTTSQPQPPTPSSSTSSSRRSSQTSSSSINQSSVTRNDLLRDTEEQLHSAVPILQQPPTSSSSASSSPRFPPVVTDAPSRREPTPTTPPTPDPTISTPTSPLTPASERPPRALPAITSDSFTTTTTSSSSSSGSVARKPLNEPCCICLEPIRSVNSSVYCRRQCGTNVHRECFATWRVQCLQNWDERNGWDGGRAGGLTALEERERRRTESVSCVYCRAKWIWELEE